MARPTASNGLGLAAATALRVADGAEDLERLLRVVLEACGAERVFLALDGAELRVVACSSGRDDGIERPSHGALRRALAASRPWTCVDSAVDRVVGTESVRALALRSILAVPVPLRPPGRAALVIDSRRGLALRARETLEALAALVGLLLRAAKHAPGCAQPAEPASGFVSPAFRAMHAWLRQVAPTELPVLIIGESGSGKEGISRLLHRWSRRGDGPFLAVNCAALTETLLEAELFGATRGAYTGADRDRPGLFALADGGTLLLDEVADMPSAMQAKLLRVLEERRVRPVGGADERPVDTRVVAATHRDLAREVARGRFRADLYHRLAVLRVEVPPLRRRTQDLPRLVEALAPRLERETGRALPPLAPEAWQRLAAHAWPGNVRELHAVLARASLRARGAELTAGDLDLAGAASVASDPHDAPPPLERTMIETALASTGGKLAAAAGRIGWSRQKLYRRMRALRLSVPASRITSSDSSTFQ